MICQGVVSGGFFGGGIFIAHEAAQGDWGCVS